MTASELPQPSATDTSAATESRLDYWYDLQDAWEHMNDVLDSYETQGDEFRLNAAKMIFGAELIPEEGMRWM